jgi:hypothetical protein
MRPNEARFRIGSLFFPLVLKPCSVCLLVFDIRYPGLHAPELYSCTYDGPSAKFADRLSRRDRVSLLLVSNPRFSAPLIWTLPLYSRICYLNRYTFTYSYQHASSFELVLQR